MLNLQPTCNNCVDHVLDIALVGFCPMDLMTVPSSVIVPSPFSSNKENASLNSAIRFSDSWAHQLILVLTTCVDLHSDLLTFTIITFPLSLLVFVDCILLSIDIETCKLTWVGNIYTCEVHQGLFHHFS